MSLNKKTVFIWGGSAILIFNLFICVYLLLGDKENLVVPQTKSEIPFIPQGANQKIVVGDLKPAILEGKTSDEISEKINEDGTKTEGISQKMPSIETTVKNDEPIQCNEFIANKDETEKFIKVTC